MRASVLLILAAATLAQQVQQPPAQQHHAVKDPPPMVYEQQRPPPQQVPQPQVQPVQPQLVQHPAVPNPAQHQAPPQQQQPRPPQQQQMPPQQQQVPPQQQQMPPQQQQMPPQQQQMPPQQQQMPPQQQQMPPQQQQMPPQQQQMPPQQQQMPPQQQQMPPQQQQMPPQHQQVPPQHQQMPPQHQQMPHQGIPGAGVPHPHVHGHPYANAHPMYPQPPYGGPAQYPPGYAHPGMEQPPNIQMQPANVVDVNPIHVNGHPQGAYGGLPPGAYHPAYFDGRQGAHQMQGGHPPEPLGHPAYAGGPMRDVDLPEEEYRKLQAEQLYHSAGRGNETVTGDPENLAVEWERVMTDFLPDMIVTFRLASGSQEFFSQDVGKEPVLIRGGFFESTDEHSGAISFQIVSPSGKVTYQSSKGEGLFRITTEESGTYTFAVSNTAWTGHKFVTFVVGAGIQKQLTAGDVETLDGNIQMLYRMLGDMETQSSYLWVRQKSHLESVNATARQTYHALIVGLVMTGLATVFQLNIIKRMVAHRRMF